MKIGMTLPSMVDSYSRNTTLEWCRLIDQGPFESISVGERVTYHNQDIMVLLSAAAALRPRFTELYGADGLIEDPAAGLRYTQGRVCSEEAVGIGASLRGGAVPSTCSEIPL